MDVVACWGRFSCVGGQMGVYALVCWLVLAFVIRYGLGFACVSCVYACAQPLHVLLGGEIEGLHIAWNSQAWFWKKRGPSFFFFFFFYASLSIHVLPVHWLALALGFVWWFWWPEIWWTQSSVSPAAKRRRTTLLLCICVVVPLCIRMYCSAFLRKIPQSCHDCRFAHTSLPPLKVDTAPWLYVGQPHRPQRCCSILQGLFRATKVTAPLKQQRRKTDELICVCVCVCKGN